MILDISVWGIDVWGGDSQRAAKKRSPSVLQDHGGPTVTGLLNPQTTELPVLEFFLSATYEYIPLVYTSSD